MLFAVGAISFFSKCKSIHDYFHFQYIVYVVDIFQPLSLTQSLKSLCNIDVDTCSMILIKQLVYRLIIWRHWVYLHIQKPRRVILWRFTNCTVENCIVPKITQTTGQCTIIRVGQHGTMPYGRQVRCSHGSLCHNFLGTDDLIRV